jgi:hypothetical protein
LVTAVLGGTLTLGLVAGCGSSSPDISPDASRQLNLQVQAVRNAAAALDRDGAAAALAEVRKSVTDLRAHGKISADRAAKARDAAAAVEVQLLSIPTTTTTTTTLPPSTRGDNNDRKDH